MARLTRAQRRQQTRTRLLDAAGQVFARRGFHAATVDEVAEAAGYTKGAVYSNFANKDELFLALLDQRLATQLQQVEALYAIESSEELLAAMRGRTEQEFAAARDFGVLMVEFSLYAMRNPAAKAELAKRYRQLRSRLAELITKRYARHQTSPPMPPEHLAALALATDAGLVLQYSAEPGALPWELHADAMIQLLDPPSRRSSEPAKTNRKPETQTNRSA
ncbi:MAG TPA: TetR/AcrR family transcriptional regulator [Actinomycetota bacterium]|nr:TetR/AcrR family transcriptional regulator [Actinomycetota bacterium]